MDGILVECKTGKLDYKSYRNYSRFMLFRGRGYKIGPILFFSLSGILLAYFLLVKVPANSFSVFDSVMWSILGGLVALLLFLYFLQPKIAYKKREPLLADEIRYRFFEDRLEAESEGKCAKGTSDYKYPIFKKVYEVNTAYYLMLLLNSTAIAIPKQYLDETQIEMLSHFFSDYFGEKYENCK